MFFFFFFQSKRQYKKAKRDSAYKPVEAKAAKPQSGPQDAPLQATLQDQHIPLSSLVVETRIEEPPPPSIAGLEGPVGDVARRFWAALVVCSFYSTRS